MTFRQLIVEERCVLLQGDSANLGEVLDENTIDAIVSDPPAGISFMGRSWDGDKGGRDQWIAWLAGLLRPALRALKPGGHALLWALPRTSHWTAMALELAGFEIRDVHHHAFGTGFPKSLNISKAIDAHLGAERKVIGRAKGAASDDTESLGSFAPEYDVTAAATDEAKRWEGFGTALKPAVEHWILARKPLVGTYAENVIAHGTGALNIDGCRIGGVAPPPVFSGAKGSAGGTTYGDSAKYEWSPSATGRWPAHLSLEHADACRAVGTVEDSHVVRVGAKLGDDSRSLEFGMGRQATTTTTTTTTTKYECVIGCPVRLLDEQSGTVGCNGGDVAAEHAALGYGKGAKGQARKVTKSVGGASRFFYVAKGARAEKDTGLDHLATKTGAEITGREDGSPGSMSARAGAGARNGARNHHPTVKSVDLMRWLVRLITPPGGTVLDMFAGSGTTGVAALAEGCSFVGIEQGGEHGEYLPIIEGRLRHALAAKEDR